MDDFNYMNEFGNEKKKSSQLRYFDLKQEENMDINNNNDNDKNQNDIIECIENYNRPSSSSFPLFFQKNADCISKCPSTTTDLIPNEDYQGDINTQNQLLLNDHPSNLFELNSPSSISPPNQKIVPSSLLPSNNEMRREDCNININDNDGLHHFTQRNPLYGNNSNNKSSHNMDKYPKIESNHHNIFHSNNHSEEDYPWFKKDIIHQINYGKKNYQDDNGRYDLISPITTPFMNNNNQEYHLKHTNFLSSPSDSKNDISNEFSLNTCSNLGYTDTYHKEQQSYHHPSSPHVVVSSSSSSSSVGISKPKRKYGLMSRWDRERIKITARPQLSQISNSQPIPHQYHTTNESCEYSNIYPNPNSISTPSYHLTCV